MKKVNSISLLIMGIGLLVLARIMENVYLQVAATTLSIGLSIMAIVKNLREKRDNKQ